MSTQDQEIYFVKQDFGKSGQAATIDYQRCSKSDVLEDIAGTDDVLGVFYMNVSEGVCRDVTEDFARELFEEELLKVRDLDEFSPFVMQFHPDYVAEFNDHKHRSAPALVFSRTNPYGAQPDIAAE